MDIRPFPRATTLRYRRTSGTIIDINAKSVAWRSEPVLSCETSPRHGQLQIWKSHLSCGTSMQVSADRGENTGFVREDVTRPLVRMMAWTKRRTMMWKMAMLTKRTKTTTYRTTLSASLRSPHAQQHVTRTILYEHVQHKCRSPEPRPTASASKHSRNARLRVTRAALCGNFPEMSRKWYQLTLVKTGIHAKFHFNMELEDVKTTLSCEVSPKSEISLCHKNVLRAQMTACTTLSLCDLRGSLSTFGHLSAPPKNNNVRATITPKPVWGTNDQGTLGLSKVFHHASWNKLWKSLSDHGVYDHLRWVMRPLCFKQCGCIQGSRGRPRLFDIKCWPTNKCYSEPPFLRCVHVDHARVAATSWTGRCWCDSSLVNVHFCQWRFSSPPVQYKIFMSLLNKLVAELTESGVLLNTATFNHPIFVPSRTASKTIQFKNGTWRHKLFGCVRCVGAGGKIKLDEYHFQVASKASLASRQTLCDRNVQLKGRLRFFDAVVSPVALFWFKSSLCSRNGSG